MICESCGSDIFETFDVTMGGDTEWQPCCLWAQDHAAGIWSGHTADRLMRDVNLDVDVQIVTGSWQRVVFDFIRQHHRHHTAPVGWRYGVMAWRGPLIVGVAVVGRPVARGIDHKRVVEVTRVCAAGDRWVRANVCSMLYAASRREAKRRGFDQLITYTLARESGQLAKRKETERSADNGRQTGNAPRHMASDKNPNGPPPNGLGIYTVRRSFSAAAA